LNRNYIVATLQLQNAAHFTTVFHALREPGHSGNMKMLY
jgi:hypothetical protein